MSVGQVPTSDMTFTFDRLSGVPAARKYSLGTVLSEAHSQAVCSYNFDTLGGDVSTITLKDTDGVNSCVLPGNAIILNAFLDVTEDLAGTGTPQVALQMNGNSEDLRAAGNASSITSAAPIQLIPDWANLSDAIKLGDSSTYAVELVVTSAALTAGKFRVFLNYALGE